MSIESTHTDHAGAAWLQDRTHQLVDLISTPTVEPRIAVLALLVAMGLGALHALSPGHGKSIVGAYLVGSRGTPRHALFLGITVTLTHTLVVFAIGIATLFSSRYILPERLFPALNLLSGLLVLGMGLFLLMQRWRGARDAVAEALVERVEATRRKPLPLRTRPRYGMTRKPARRAGEARLMHTHDGGTPHSHLPPGGPGEAVSWRGLLALGISGGLVPCPSAMVLLLTAIALGKIGYGLLMVVSFSVGLAATLVAVGLLFLYAGSRLVRPDRKTTWTRVLPVLSATFIVAVGLVLCYGALTSSGLATLRP